MTSNFRNRHRELERLHEAYRHTERGPIAVVLRGNSGCGKSSLVHRFLERLSAHQTIHVRDVDQPANSRTPFKFVHNITQTLEKRHRDGAQFPSFSSHLKSEEPHLLHGLKDAVLADFGRLLRVEGLSKEMSNRILSQSNTTESRILRSEIPETIDTKIDYIRKSLSYTATVMSIENIHSIDYSSLEQFPHTLPESRHNMYIFEYTDNTLHGWNIDEIDRVIDLLGFKRVHIAVGRMGIDDVLAVLGVDGDRHRETIRNAYVQCNGNLRHLANLEFQILESGIDPDTGNQEISKQPIKNLPKEQQLIFSFIHIFCDPVPESYLQTLEAELENGGLNLDLEAVLTHLDRRGLITRKSGNVLSPFGRASLHIYDDTQLERLLFLAVKYWIHFYESAGQDATGILSGESERTERLVYLYGLVHNYEKILSNLDRLRDLLIKSQSPNYLRGLFGRLFQHCLQQITNSAHNSAMLKICLIYYEVGLYIEVLDMIGAIRSKSEPLPRGFRLIYWASKYMLEKNDEVLREIDVEINSTIFEENPRYVLSLRVLELSVLRSSNNIDRHKKLHERLHNTTGIKDLPEYGYVLRHSEIAKPLSDCIPDLRHSIDHFEKTGLTEIAAISCLNLGMQLALQGELAEAGAIFDRGEKKVGGSAAHRHKFLNNRAAVSLYQEDNKGHSSNRRLLDVALRLAIVPFDRIVILNNLLLVGLRTNRADDLIHEARELRETLESYKSTDQHLHQVTYFNISCVFREAGRDREAAQFLDLSRRCDVIRDQIWNFRYTGEGKLDDGDQFLARQSIIPCFLADWHYYPGDSLRHWDDANEYSNLKN